MRAVLDVGFDHLKGVGFVLASLLVLSACADAPEFIHTPQMPRNLEPALDSSLNNGMQIRFQWRAVELASEYEFHVFDRSSGAVVNQRTRLYSERVCDGDICSIEEVLSLPPLSGHAWRVRAINPAGPSPWSRSTFAVIR